MTEPSEVVTGASAGGSSPAGAPGRTTDNTTGRGSGTTRPASGGTGASGGSGKGDGLNPPSWLAMTFLLPAILLLGALVVYPIVYSVFRSLFDASGSTFVGAANYIELFSEKDSLTSIRNTAIWVVVGPTLVTILGLVFAVLTERIKWATAFKMVVFMPMAISFLASGVVFRLVYEQDPEKGVANAAIVAVHDTFAGSAGYPGAEPRSTSTTPTEAKEDGNVVSKQTHQVGQAVLMPLVKVKQEDIPPEAATVAKRATLAPDALTGTVWFDFTKGGGGRPNVPDSTEQGLPNLKVEAVDAKGVVVAEATTGPDGTFSINGLPQGSYTVRLPKENFAPPFRGASWLGNTLVTPAIIGSYIWVWAGFAMVLIAAGLAAIPRDALEAARVDGATEGQVFRRVTMPLLSPVLVVVFVTLSINVLKVFDLVYIIGGSNPEASVLALQMWVESFGGGNNEGMGSAVAVLLFLLVLPAMLFQVRRFRREQA
jgi:ABC-type sugar transport system permease subunit